MSHEKDDPVRDAIFRRIGATQFLTGEREPGTPLDWDDFGFLCQGLSFAPRALFVVTREITERYSLGPRGAWMLNLISAGIVYPHELSNVFHIGRSLISAELARLTEAGLIESRPGATDRRRSELALTKLGEKVHDEIRDGLANMLTKALSAYSPDEVRLAARILRDLRVNTSAPQE